MDEHNKEEILVVEELLGRRPQGKFEIAVRRSDGTPRVIKNAPFLDDGTPMPTLYWLIDPVDKLRISRLESNGAIPIAEAEIGLGKIDSAHERYKKERNKMIPDSHSGPAPTGGVGGTRVGVKCLHAHYAWFLAGGDDPVGIWTEQKLIAEDLNE
ncbi:MAG: septum formation initiator family protein [Acidimicrobiaceae bacterium]|nr:septum formation initiator family protein [Acidimicrobiaceae bacterium]